MSLNFFVLIISSMVTFSIFWALFIFFKFLLLIFKWFSMHKINLEEFLEKMYESDEIVPLNNLEAFFCLTGVIFVFLAFAFWVLSEFQNIQILKIFQPKHFLAIGYFWIVIGKSSLFCRQVNYCLERSKKSDLGKLLKSISLLIIDYFQQITQTLGIPSVYLKTILFLFILVIFILII